MQRIIKSEAGKRRFLVYKYMKVIIIWKPMQMDIDEEQSFLYCVIDCE